MRVVVFGATGATGRLVVEHLLSEGHEVTGFVRRPESLPLRQRLTLVVGDVLNQGDVSDAVAGQDAVVVALGIRENPLLVRFRGASNTATNVRSAGTRNIIAAMESHDVRKLTVLTTYGVGSSRDGLSWFWRMMFSLLLANQIADTEVQEELVRHSGLDWVVVQPVSLVDEPMSGELVVSPHAKAASMKVPRVEVARVLADATIGAHESRQVLAVSAMS